MTREEARIRAAHHIREGILQPEGFTPVIVDEATCETTWGWLFFYTSAEYLTSGNVLHAIAGNSPIAVSRADGQIYETGTARPLEEYVAAIGAEICQKAGGS